MTDPLDSELIQNLVKHFSRLERRQKHFMNDSLKSSGLHGMMYKYIITVKRHPGTSQDFLAEFHSVDKSRVARVVRDLEKMGCLSRTANENNRRCYMLSLTSEGERLFEMIQQVLVEWGKRISKDIPGKNIIVTAETIEKMISNAD